MDKGPEAGDGHPGRDGYDSRLGPGTVFDYYQDAASWGSEGELRRFRCVMS